MTASSAKTESIMSDKMKFRTQIIDGKPQIFFDTNENSTTKTRSKRNSRATNGTSRLPEQQKTKANNQISSAQNGTNRQKMRTDHTTNKSQVNEDGSTLGVYMTMDELAELVKAVKENNKNENKPNTEFKQEPLPPPPPPPPQQQQYNETAAPVNVPRLDLPSEAPQPRGSPREQVLSIMAEKKRQKWLREKAEIERLQLEIEYDQLKHQLSPRHNKNSVSPERSTFQYDFPPTNNKPPPVPSAQQSNKPNGYQNDISPKVNEYSNNDTLKTQLMEKKQQQWKQENADRMNTWNPFGRPGAGAPNINENNQRPSQLPPNNVVSYRSPMQQQQQYPESSSPGTRIYNDQTQVPAAMRRNLLFGDVRFEEDVKTAKEIERRQWLDDLQKQVEENRQKKYGPIPPERRQDFLQENVKPLLQEAANRHQQPINDRASDFSDTNKFDRRSQLMDKLQRNGYPIESLTKNIPDGKSNGTGSYQTSGEKLFGPTYDSTAGQYANSRAEQLHLNVGINGQQAYRTRDARRDEAVNTVDSTFRSDHSVQTEFGGIENQQANPYSYRDSDLSTKTSNPHYRNAGYRNIPNQPGKKNPRIHSQDDNNISRRTSTMNNTYGTDDGAVSRTSNHRSAHGQPEIQSRPIWNYKNPQHREYVPNSKRDPNYEKRQRLKHFAEGNFDRIDDVQKQVCYNRWNSDSELEQPKKSAPLNRIRSTTSKTQNRNQKEESIMNLLKLQNRYEQGNAAARKASSVHPRNDDEHQSNRASVLDRYENYMPPIQSDEVFDRTKINSPSSHSRDTSPHKELLENNTHDNYQQQEWNNANRQMPISLSPQYNPPQSRHEHILQQLSAIKENLIRRQRELAT